MTDQSKPTLELTEYILSTIREPLIILDGDLRVKTASYSFYKVFQVSVKNTVGSFIYDLGDGQWDIPALRQLLTRIISEDSTIESFEVEHKFPILDVRTFLLNARRVQSANGPIDAILLAFEDITERKKYEALLRHLARTDPLTKLANRYSFDAALGEAIKVGRRFEFGIALLMIDLDDFKLVNDTCGHPIGDILLQKVAGILSSCVREVDTVARLGGDEFAVILKGAQRREDADRLAIRYIDAISHPFDISGHTVSIGASIGISSFPIDAENADDLLRRADLALYQAKAMGKNKCCKFSTDLEK
ncbi:MAG: diguanylate cyclase [Alphaproteobacteria bacterium]|nr:diguanylate cyclase [Alphaproteobacteria bacterium]